MHLVNSALYHWHCESQCAESPHSRADRHASVSCLVKRPDRDIRERSLSFPFVPSLHAHRLYSARAQVSDRRDGELPGRGSHDSHERAAAASSSTPLLLTLLAALRL
jgi:hypothetical protein